MRLPALLFLMLLFCTIQAADATPAIPAPSSSATVPTLDDATLARANAAADAYAKSVAAQHTPPSPAAQDAIAAAELNILEAGTYLDQHDVTRAGDCYLAARKLIKDLPDADRPLLGARLTAARNAVAVLSQRLLTADKGPLGEMTATTASATMDDDKTLEHPRDNPNGWKSATAAAPSTAAAATGP